jgi:beta-glucosidase
MNDKIRTILASLTLEEKASLCSGHDFWHTQAIQRLGIPAIMLTDGPHGLRKQAGDSETAGLTESVPATCFPTASATANSWDRELMKAIGQALGEECQQEEVAVILGPGANIKRSPLCGRNFEYFSEDPYLSGEMAASLIQGVQSQGVGASLKHFAVNNQEHLRMTINAVVDERALREIYLTGFEIAVKKGKPWTVMCSYNRLDGVYCSEYERLLTKILREEWGFAGLLVTDWGACNDRVAGLKAGQDLEMPSSNGTNDALILAAVKSGALDESILDRAVERILELIFRAVENRKTAYRYAVEAHHKLARRAAAEAMLLFKNADGILPLKAGAKVALIGGFAKTPRYQGSGSSLIKPSRLDCAWDELNRVAPGCTYAAGYDLKTDQPDEALIAEACAAACAADVVLVFAGLPDVYESEGFDRAHMRLPQSHNLLIQRVAAANPNTVVVLSNGSAVEMPWLDSVKAVLGGFLGGQAGGSAAVDVLFGVVNPSGKLAETYPLNKLEDNPSHRYFPGGPKTVEYRESIYVGYRYYDSAHKPVRFPFGYGLSYTTFAYSDLQVSAKHINEQDELKVSVKVKNTGNLAGSEIVQLYVCDVASTIFRPAKELKGFDKLFLHPGEEKRLEFTLNQRSFAYYNTHIAGWHVESGEFEILVGASSADIRLRATVWVESSQPALTVPSFEEDAPVYYRLPAGELLIPDGAFRALYGKDIPPNQRLPGEPYTITSTLDEIKSTFIGRRIYAQVLANLRKALGGGENETLNLMVERMIGDMPLRNLVTFSAGRFSFEMVNSLLLLMNGKLIPGILAIIRARRKKPVSAKA